MPYLRQAERATRKYRPRFTCKNICITILATLLVLTPPILLLGFLPYHRAITFEQNYFTELQRLETIEQQWKYVPDFLPDSPRLPPAYNNRLLPLIHDIPQLASWGYLEQLGLNEDRTGQQLNTEAWIYVGGTPKKPDSFLDKISASSKPNGSCVDSEDICSSYNEGFNRLVEEYHVSEAGRGAQTSKATLAFMDCDVSPLLCDFFQLSPVMLMHLKTMQPCRMEYDVELKWFCSTRWTLIGLPLPQMPFTKSQTIAGHVVPIFPSAFEQLNALVATDGNFQGAGLEENKDVFVIIETIVGGEDEDGV